MGNSVHHAKSFSLPLLARGRLTDLDGFTWTIGALQWGTGLTAIGSQTVIIAGTGLCTIKSLASIQLDAFHALCAVVMVFTRNTGLRQSTLFDGQIKGR